MVLKLDKIDKRILYELDKNSRIPETKLAKLTNRSKESVRYRIKKLEEKQIITGYSTWIDLERIGYTSAKIYLNLTNNPIRKKEFIKYARADKRLFWLGVADGAWNIGLTYFIKTNKEFFELKNKLFSKFKDLIIESHTGFLVDVNITPKKFLYKEDVNWQIMFGTKQTHKLDEIEKKLLKEIYKNSRESIVKIAHNTNTTTDIARGRIKKLEEKKIITKYLAKINFNKLKYEFYKTFLYFKNLTPQDETKLFEHCKNHPNILHIVRQISPWDIELEIMCESYHEYNEIMNELTQKFSEIINKVDTAIMSEDYVFPSQKLIFE
ncbi:MAG: Lrp/AsnC family transcriptional regulator [Candidatus Woesearchaeota archaeon]